jgi:hypothetical protein
MIDNKTNKLCHCERSVAISSSCIAMLHVRYA